MHGVAHTHSVPVLNEGTKHGCLATWHCAASRTAHEPCNLCSGSELKTAGSDLHAAAHISKYTVKKMCVTHCRPPRPGRTRCARSARRRRLGRAVRARLTREKRGLSTGGGGRYSPAVARLADQPDSRARLVETGICKRSSHKLPSDECHAPNQDSTHPSSVLPQTTLTCSCALRLSPRRLVVSRAAGGKTGCAALSGSPRPQCQAPALNAARLTVVGLISPGRTIETVRVAVLVLKSGTTVIREWKYTENGLMTRQDYE